MGDIGWVKLHRKLIDWEWYKDVNTFKLFIHLLLKANIEAKNWQGYLIKRGQLITSIKSLSNETGLTEKQVRTALNKLEKTKEVGKQTTSQNTTLTMVNYDLYQTEGKPKGEQGANEGQAKGKARATTKEGKEYKEDKENVGEAKPKHKIIIWLENNCPTVQKMKEPITEEQAIKIHDDFNNKPELVANTFLAMENKPDLLKKYKSANLTFRNWAKNDFGNSSNSGKDNPLIEKWETPSDIFMCMDWIKRIPKPPDYETQTAAYEMFMYEWRISELMTYQYDRCGAHSNLSEYED
jgi:hypothetical protein